MSLWLIFCCWLFTSIAVLCPALWIFLIFLSSQLNIVNKGHSGNLRDRGSENKLSHSNQLAQFLLHFYSVFSSSSYKWQQKQHHQCKASKPSERASCSLGDVLFINSLPYTRAKMTFLVMYSNKCIRPPPVVNSIGKNWNPLFLQWLCAIPVKSLGAPCDSVVFHYLEISINLQCRQSHPNYKERHIEFFNKKVSNQNMKNLKY